MITTTVTKRDLEKYCPGTDYNKSVLLSEDKKQIIRDEVIGRRIAASAVTIANTAMTVTSFTPYQQNWDINMLSAGTTDVYVEVKHRRGTLRNWRYPNFTLRKWKYDKLMKLVQEGKTVWYVNTFDDDCALVWNLQDISSTGSLLVNKVQENPALGKEEQPQVYYLRKDCQFEYSAERF